MIGCSGRPVTWGGAGRVAVVLVAAFLGLWPARSPGQEAGADKPISSVLVSPPGPRSAAYVGSRLLDIPDSAKAEGHNGWVVWTVKVGADGKPLSLALKRSSGSTAIDAAAKARLEGGRFLPAISRDLVDVESDLDVHLGYFLWNADGGAGNLKSYTCADLVREFDWFSRANARTQLLFPLWNAYTSLDGVAGMMDGGTPTAGEREAQRRRREQQWSRLVDTCRKHPTALFMDQVDQPELFLSLLRL